MGGARARTHTRLSDATPHHRTGLDDRWPRDTETKTNKYTVKPYLDWLDGVSPTVLRLASHGVRTYYVALPVINLSPDASNGS